MHRVKGFAESLRYACRSRAFGGNVTLNTLHISYTFLSFFCYVSLHRRHTTHINTSSQQHSNAANTTMPHYHATLPYTLPCIPYHTNPYATTTPHISLCHISHHTNTLTINHHSTHTAIPTHHTAAYTHTPTQETSGKPMPKDKPVDDTMIEWIRMGA